MEGREGVAYKQHTHHESSVEHLPDEFETCFLIDHLALHTHSTDGELVIPSSSVVLNKMKDSGKSQLHGFQKGKLKGVT